MHLLYTSMQWTEEMEDMCERLRINSVNLSEYHRKRYYHYKGYNKWFRVPMLILASLNATGSVGLTQAGVSQTAVSGVTCVLGMVMGVLTAMEMYLQIPSAMDLEMKQSKEFYTLAIDIYKTLRLRREDRGEDGSNYLSKKYGHYVKLREQSDLLRRKLKNDVLAKIPLNMKDGTPEGTPTPSLQDIDEVYTKIEPQKSVIYVQDRRHSTLSIPEEIEEVRGKDESNDSPGPPV